jgi:hypothetical protein
MSSWLLFSTLAGVNMMFGLLIAIAPRWYSRVLSRVTNSCQNDSAPPVGRALATPNLFWLRLSGVLYAFACFLFALFGFMASCKN